MKNIFNLTVLLLVAIIGLNSCDQKVERELYDEGGPLGYSFYQKNIETVFSLEDNGKIDIKVTRSNAAAASSVPITFKESTGNFTMPTPSASFEAGKYETTVSINYVLQNLNPSLRYSMTLQIPSDQRSFSSDSILTITGNMQLTWEKYGSGTFESEFFEESWDQDLQVAKESPNLFRLPGCYYNGYNLLFTLNADNSITYATQQMGYNHPSYAMTSWAMPTATSTVQPYKDGNKFYFVPRFTVSAGSFGQFLEVLTIN